MKKILLMIILTIIIITYVPTNIYADSFVVSLPTFPSYDTEQYPYYYIKKWNNTEYTLYILKTTTVDVKYNNYYFQGEFKSYHYRVTDNIEDHKWGVANGPYNGHSDNTVIYPVGGTLEDCKITHSNFDIKYNGVLLRSKLEYSTEPIEPPPDNVTMSGIGEFFGSLFANLQQFFSNLGDKIISLGSTFTSAISNLADRIGELFLELINKVLSIPELIIQGLQNILEFLFVPGENSFTEIQGIIEEKFAFIYQIKDLVEILLQTQPNARILDSAPQFEIEYKGTKYTIIDFSMFEQYRTFIRNLTSFIMIFSTAMWILKNAPAIIHGQVINSDGVIESEVITNREGARWR